MPISKSEIQQNSVDLYLCVSHCLPQCWCRVFRLGRGPVRAGRVCPSLPTVGSIRPPFSFFPNNRPIEDLMPFFGLLQTEQTVLHRKMIYDSLLLISNERNCFCVYPNPIPATTVFNILRICQKLISEGRNGVCTGVDLSYCATSVVCVCVCVCLCLPSSIL